MLFYNRIIENLILPLNDQIFKRNVSKDLNFLQKSQWWSPEDLKKYQNEKLRLLINHAYKNVPYYRELFKANKLTPDDIKTQNDLIKIPLLTKEIIRKNFPNKIVAQNISPKKLLMSGSSGSTGQPLQYYRTKESLDFSRACNLRGWYWMGFRMGDPYLKISTMPRNKLYKRIQDILNRSVYIYSKSMNEEDILMIIDKIKKTKIKVVRGYPASLYLIARYCNKNNINDINLHCVNTTSEPLYPNMRDMIESQFHCKIFDSYGAEGAPVISECENHKTYHISDENAIVEFLRNDEIVNEGYAKMVFTDLTNYATPFVRYDIKDFAVIGDQNCECGRGLQTIDKIEGRDTDILITPSGKYITFYFFAGYFEFQDYIDMFQVTQTELDEFTLKIVPNENFNTELLEKTRKDIIKILGEDVKLNIESVNYIPLTSSGKRRFFIRDKKVPLNF